MTITLQASHTYRTRDGSAEHTIDRIEVVDGPFGDVAWSAKGQAWWARTGKAWGDEEGPTDLVEEVLPAAAQPPNPVRQRTVTEIIPGAYGRLKVGFGGVSTRLAVAIIGPSLDDEVISWSLNAEELRTLAATATQLADALDTIASEKQN